MQSQISVLGYIANSDHKFIKRAIPLCQTNQRFGGKTRTLFPKRLIKYSHILSK